MISIILELLRDQPDYTLGQERWDRRYGAYDRMNNNKRNRTKPVKTKYNQRYAGYQQLAPLSQKKKKRRRKKKD